MLVGMFALLPYFTVSSVLPANENAARPLQPGMIVSIYGRSLGPGTPCTAPEAMELCGTTVTVNGIRAPLLYVHDRQINLRVPFSAIFGESAPVAVSREGLSRSVVVPVQQEAAHISVIAHAFVHMPVWVEVRLTGHHQHSVRYPIRILPGDFGGHVFEVRRNGVEMTPWRPAMVAPAVGGGPGSPGSIGGGGFLGLPSEPKHKGRLPLHLAFRFEQPGRYEVRYTGYDWGTPGQNARILVRSKWTAMEVMPHSEAQRAEWLRRMRDTAPANPVDLLTDYLPSLLARPDAEVLRLLEPYGYNANDFVRQYVMYAFYLFDDALLGSWVPDLIRRRGPTTDMAYFLSWRRDLFGARAAELAGLIIPHLRSVHAAGALQSLAFMRMQYRDLVDMLDAAVLREAPGLRRSGSEEVIRVLDGYLSAIKHRR